MPPKGPLAEAIGYTLNHWVALNRYLDDGRLEIDNNAIERAIRPVAQGRANWLFVASERGGHAAAALYSLIESAKTNGHNPYAYLRDVLTRLPVTKAKDIRTASNATPSSPRNWIPSTRPLTGTTSASESM